jgi:hypothetical protein
VVPIVGITALVLVLPAADVVQGSAWSLLPALVAITLALVVREVIASLIAGVWLGTTMLAGGNPLAGFLHQHPQRTDRF